MKRTKLAPVSTSLVSLLLLFCLALGIMIGDRAYAQGAHGGHQDSTRKANKISSDLRARARQTNASTDRVKVILQFKGEGRAALNTLLQRSGVNVKGQLQNFNSSVVELPASLVEELASSDEVAHV